MRPYRSIAAGTALETLSDPLGLLLSAAAMATTVLASTFHIHQFGESWRMARDATLSSMLVFSLLAGVFLSIKSIRREVEDGTLEMVLSHAVSRFGYSAAKFCGVFAACVVLFVPVFFCGLAVVLGAQAGGWMSSRTGDIPLMWGPAAAAGVVSIVLPFAAGAVLNRFFNLRFALSAASVSPFCAALSYAAVRWYAAKVFPDSSEASDAAWRMAPAAAMLVPPLAVFASAAGAFSVKLRDNAAATLCGVLFAAALPALGNHYVSEALAGGGSVPWIYVAAAFAASAPFASAFLLAEACMLEGSDI